MLHAIADLDEIDYDLSGLSNLLAHFGEDSSIDNASEPIYDYNDIEPRSPKKNRSRSKGQRRIYHQTFISASCQVLADGNHRSIDEHKNIVQELIDKHSSMIDPNDEISQEELNMMMEEDPTLVAVNSFVMSRIKRGVKNDR